MIRTLLSGLALGVILVTAAYTDAQSPSGQAVPSCEAQLADAQRNNATLSQLYRDVAQQRTGHEVQSAATRTALGNECPDTPQGPQPVSQCIETLVRAKVELAKQAAAAKEPAKGTPAK